MADDCIGESVAKEAENLKIRRSVFLENVRFYKEEEKNDAGICQKAGQSWDVYGNDALGTAHRAHASTAGIADHLPAYASVFLMEKEVKMLESVPKFRQSPRMAILGGSQSC